MARTARVSQVDSRRCTFAACSVAFGGRFLRFGAGAAEAVHEADLETRRVVRAALKTTAR